MYRSLMALIDRVGGSPGGTPEAGAVSGLAHVPEQLVAAVESGECFLFAGEELGRSSGMPVWSRFLVGLIDYLADDRIIAREQADKLHQIWKNGRYERVARVIREAAPGAEKHAAAYARSLYSKPAPLSATLEALAKVPFSAAVTPNLDNLVQRITGFDAFSPADALVVEDRLAESVPFVLKLRGGVGDRWLNVWQDTATEQMRPDCAEALRELFRTRTMLALGVGPDDLQRWLDAAGIAHADRTHYLIAAPGDRELKRKAETLYRKFHVQILLPAEDETGELLAFLHKLAVHEKFRN